MTENEGGIRVSIATCQPIPRLSTEGGKCVALPYLTAAIYVPVDCQEKLLLKQISTHQVDKSTSFKDGTRATRAEPGLSTEIFTEFPSITAQESVDYHIHAYSPLQSKLTNA